MAQEDLRKKVDLAFLSAFYGGLLTEKQRRVLSLHCEEDLSLGEIAADVAVTFDPHDAGEIASALERLLTEDAASRAARIARGLEHVKRFSWEEHAKGIARLLENEP